MFLKPELNVPDAHLPCYKASSKILHPCYRLLCIAVLFTLRFNLYKISQSFHQVHTYDQVLRCVLDPPVLDARQFNQAILVKRLVNGVCGAPAGKKLRKQGIHLLCPGRLWLQGKHPLNTMKMSRRWVTNSSRDLAFRYEDIGAPESPSSWGTFTSAQQSA